MMTTAHFLDSSLKLISPFFHFTSLKGVKFEKKVMRHILRRPVKNSIIFPLAGFHFITKNDSRKRDIKNDAVNYVKTHREYYR
jgi:hypothetical protein